MSILICYDGSPSSRAAVRIAADTLLANSAVLLHVWQPPLPVLADSFADQEQDGDDRGDHLERVCRNFGQRILSEGEALAAEHDLNIEGRLERCGRATWRTILDVAEAIGAQLIVIGTRGHAVVETNLLGSVSAAVVHHSERPVLIVPVPTVRTEVGSPQPALGEHA